MPETKSHRSTSFGFGTKMDITSSSSKTPAPNVYNVSTDFS